MRAIILGALMGAVAASALAVLPAAAGPVVAHDGQFEADVSARNITRIAIAGEKVATVRKADDGQGPKMSVDVDAATGDVFVEFDGDVVGRTKPDPEIYELAKTSLGLPASECIVIEDSRNGLLAATGAGLPCLITMSAYTTEEDFHEAVGVVSELGDSPNAQVTLDDLARFASKHAASTAAE